MTPVWSSPLIYRRPLLADTPPVGTPASQAVPASGPPHSSPTRPIVRLESASRRFGQVIALDDVDLQVERGEIFGIIGRSGAGKSTLVRTLNALERVDEGRVVVDGHDLSSLNEAGLNRVRRGIGMIFQHFNLLSAKTVFENVELPLKLAGRSRADRAGAVWRLLELVGLRDKADVHPARLSGGQKQRVGIARALVAGPSLLLSDEATSALDPETTLSILRLLKTLNASLGVTIVLITHEMSVIREICDQVAVLDQGRIVEQGPVWQVFARPRADITRRLLRTVRPPLPQALRDRLLAEAPAVGRTLLRVDAGADDGHAGALAILAGAAGGRAAIEHAEVDRIGEHSVGSVTFSVPVAAAGAVQAAFAEHEVTVEVLGHVAG